MLGEKQRMLDEETGGCHFTWCCHSNVHLQVTHFFPTASYMQCFSTANVVDQFCIATPIACSLRCKNMYNEVKWNMDPLTSVVFILRINFRFQNCSAQYQTRWGCYCILKVQLTGGVQNSILISVVQHEWWDQHAQQRNNNTEIAK